MHVFGTTKVTPEQVKQAKFILENWDLHNLHPYKTKAMYFGNESKANESKRLSQAQKDIVDDYIAKGMNDYEFFGNVSDALMPQLKEIEDKGKTEVELYDALQSYTKKHIRNSKFPTELSGMGYESKANEGKYHVIIKNRKTGEIAEDMIVDNFREAMDVEAGASINMNRADWKIVIESETESKPEIGIKRYT